MAAVGAPRVVRMFSRRLCGLCDEARAVILREQDQAPDRFRFEETFIDGDFGLEREYGQRVPVVLIDGALEFEYQVEPARFRALVSV